ncbi:MAG TPA: hypothetical protein VNJ70_17870 [Thermoanaerobaculia bacterium]|nr:hypothetical protein [Thermoanaerobaculia bacterium]
MNPPITKGTIAPATFDGYVIRAAGEWEVRETELKANHQAASGQMREQRAWSGGAAYPAIAARHTFTLDYAHLGGAADAVRDRLAFPGPHSLCLWKHFFLGYYGDGARTDFLLKPLWRVGYHSLVPPDGLTADHFATQVLVGLETAPLTLLDKTTANYNAGEPAAGEVWFEENGIRWKLGTAPSAGAQVVVRVVPIFQVLTGGESERRHTDPLREPRRLVLEEM